MRTCMVRLTTVAAVIACVGMLSTRAEAQAGAAPTDPQIVGIVVAANQIDIDYAQLALSKSQNKQVRDFAQQMVTDHSALQKAVFDLGAKLNVTPADSETSNSLKSQAEETINKLKSLKGEVFDKAYLDNEVAFHKLVMNANSSVLIPNAQNTELKDALKGAQPLFAGHLEHAQQIHAAAATQTDSRANAQSLIQEVTNVVVDVESRSATSYSIAMAGHILNRRPHGGC